MKKLIIMFFASLCLTATFVTTAVAAPVYNTIDLNKYIDFSSYISKYNPWLETYKKNIITPEETEVTITYDACGGVFYNAYSSPATASTKSVIIKAGETHNIINAKPTKGIYLFNGWRDSDGNIYKVGDKIVPTNNIILTAIWKQKFVY